MSYELIAIDDANANRLTYRARHSGAIIGRLLGLPFLAVPFALAYGLIFHRAPDFGQAPPDMPTWLQFVIAGVFLPIPLILGALGAYLTLRVRGFELDRSAGTIREYSGIVRPWKQKIHRIRDFREVAIREEPGRKSGTIHAVYLVGSDQNDLRIDAWDRWEAEAEASRLARFLDLKVMEA